MTFGAVSPASAAEADDAATTASAAPGSTPAAPVEGSVEQGVTGSGGAEDAAETPADETAADGTEQADGSEQAEGTEQADGTAQTEGAGAEATESTPDAAAPETGTPDEPAAVAAPEDDAAGEVGIAATPDTVRVLAVNDFHGRLEVDASNQGAGAASLAGAIDALGDDDTIFASAGDAVGASTFPSAVADDEPTIEALIEAGLDVGAVGNHEFDGGFADVKRIQASYAAYKGAGDGREYVLGANVRNVNGTPALPEYSVVTTGNGKRIAFVGVVTDDLPSLVSSTGLTGLTIEDPTIALNRTASGVLARGEADVVIALVHEGPSSTSCPAIADPATKFGEIVTGASADVAAIISGHTHLTVDCEYPVSGRSIPRPVLMAGQYGSHLDQLTMQFEAGTNTLISIDGSLIDLYAGATPAPVYPADADVKAIVDAAVAQAEVLGAVPLGNITADSRRAFTAAGAEDRGSESSLGNLVADIHLYATSENPDYGGERPAELALMNPGGVRADLLYAPDGVVSYKNAATVQPFANTLVTLDLTGAQLKQVLEQQWQPAGASRPKLHLGVSDGFTYVYDDAAAAGSRIISMTLNGQAVTPTQVIRVVANSFLAAGGDNFGAFASGTNRADSGIVDLDASVLYFADVNPVTPPGTDRALTVAEAPAGGGQPGTGTPGTPGDGSGTPGAGSGTPGAGPGTPGAGSGTPGAGAGTSTGASSGAAIGRGGLAYTGVEPGTPFAAGLLLLLGGAAIAASAAARRRMMQRG